MAICISTPIILLRTSALPWAKLLPRRLAIKKASVVTAMPMYRWMRRCHVSCLIFNMGKIVVVEYGMGNLRSVAQVLRHVGPETDVRISGEGADIRSADRIVLPGQGAMPD